MEENKLPVKPEDMGIEEILGMMENLLLKMDDEASIEKLFEYYKQGLDLAALCNTKIDKIEQQVQILRSKDNEDGE